MMGALCAVMYGTLPFIMLRDSLTYSSTSLNSIFIFRSLFIVGVAGSSGYMVKRNKDCEKAFNMLNSELGENALPDKIKEAYEEKQDLDAKLESKLREISIILSQLQEQKKVLELFADDDNEIEKTLEPTVSEEHTIEKKDTIFRYSQEDLKAFMDEDIFDDVEREQ